VCVLEGPDLVQAALEAAVEFEALYLDGVPSARDEWRSLATRAAKQGVRTFYLAPGVLERVASATAPQPMLAAVRLPVVGLDAVPCNGLVLVLHDVRDPGNAGTLVRSAEAAGASGVVFTGQSVDPVNPKTLRATAGAIFRVPVACATLESALATFSAKGAVSYGTVIHGGMSYREVDLRRPTAVVVGNEASGLDDDALALCDERMSIEMVGAAESLNAGVAGSLILFEALRQREGTTALPPTPSL